MRGCGGCDDAMPNTKCSINDTDSCFCFDFDFGLPSWNLLQSCCKVVVSPNSRSSSCWTSGNPATLTVLCCLIVESVTFVMVYTDHIV